MFVVYVLLQKLKVWADGVHIFLNFILVLLAYLSVLQQVVTIIITRLYFRECGCQIIDEFLRRKIKEKTTNEVTKVV